MISVLISVWVSLGLTGCSNKEAQAPAEDQTQSAVQAQQAPDQNAPTDEQPMVEHPAGEHPTGEHPK